MVRISGVNVHGNLLKSMDLDHLKFRGKMKIKQQKGSFLLEFLIAAAIFIFGIVGVVKLQNRSMSNLSDLSADMAIPILIEDFAARVNLGSIDEGEVAELANALYKNVTISGETITITDQLDTDNVVTYTAPKETFNNPGLQR